MTGKKIYETRVYDEKRQKIGLRNIILFKDRDSDRQFIGIVNELSYFETFREAVIDCGLRKVLPNVRSLEKAVSLYESFPHKCVIIK